MATKDKELTAMAKCVQVLGELEQEPRARVMWWLNEKFPTPMLVETQESVSQEFPMPQAVKR